MNLYKYTIPYMERGQIKKNEIFIHAKMQSAANMVLVRHLKDNPLGQLDIFLQYLERGKVTKKERVTYIEYPKEYCSFGSIVIEVVNGRQGVLEIL